MSEISILFAGDFCPINRSERLILSGREPEIFGDLHEQLRGNDLSVLNLECPLTTQNTPIAKSGPNLKAHPLAVRAVTAGGFDVACLANNHIADQGSGPVLNTIDLLRAGGIRTVGAGESIHEAQKPLRLTLKGKRIVLLAFAENEFTCADERTAGAWPLEVPTNIDQIRKASRSADIVIVMVHGGNEFNPVPSPRMVKTYRAFAEAGASAVVAGHPHVPQGYEVHNGVPIIYSLGNFVFDLEEDAADVPLWSTGLLARLTFRDDAVKVELIPFRAIAETSCLERIRGSLRKQFLAYIRFLSRLLGDDRESRRYWDAWCVLNGPKWAHYLDRGVAPWKDAADRGGFLTARNVLMCEAHHELLCNYMELVRKKRITQARKYIPRIKRLERGLLPQ